MAVPPALPSRPSQRAPMSMPPPQLPPRTTGSLNAKKVEQAVEPVELLPRGNDDGDEDDDVVPHITISRATTTTTVSQPRFIAPPSTTTPTTNPPPNPLQRIIQPLLHMLAINPSDTHEESLLRKQIEEEQISRYMGSFSKHVQYLRMDGGPAVEPPLVGMGIEERGVQVHHGLEKPSKERFRVPVVTSLAPGTAPGTGTGTGPASVIATESTFTTDSNNAAASSAKGLQEEKSSGEDGDGDEDQEVDWFGYYAALAVYYLHLHIPSLRPVPPETAKATTTTGAPLKSERGREPFTISRLRSSVERLYVDARSPWGALLGGVGEVVMWRDVGVTIKWLSVYVLLTITNTFTPFLLSIPLYHLIKERIFPPSVAQLREKEREASERLKEGHELASDIVQPSAGTGMGTTGVGNPFSGLNYPTLPGGMGGEFAAEAAMRGLGMARDSVASYAFGNGVRAGGGVAGEEEDAGAGAGAVNEDILQPHVKRFVSGVLKQGSSATPTTTPTATITELDSTEGELAATEEDPSALASVPVGKNGKGKEKKEKKEKVKKATSGDAGTGKGKSKTTKLRDKWEEFKVVHGTGLIVVLDDLADIHERVESLFAWRRPESSVKFAMILILAILGAHFMPAFWMLKLFQVAIGVVLFIVIPVAARMERYEPISASMTSAPTMAEHVINVMRDRAARGEPLPEFRPAVKAPSRKETALSTSDSITTSDHASTTSLPLTNTEIQEEVVRIDNGSDTESISADATSTGSAKRKVDWGAMRDQAVAHAHTGTQWWQTGKELWKGEKKVQFSWKGSSEDWENIENSALAARQVSLGAKGPGIHLSVHSTGEQSPYIKEGVSYLARHAGYTGQLYLSSEGLMFVPMIGSAASTTTETTTQATITAEDSTQQADQETTKPPPTEKQKPEVQVPMSTIVGMRKSNKTAMGVIVSAGLQIDVQDGSSIVFSFVANRDVVFNRLLALSKGTFRRV